MCELQAAEMRDLEFFFLFSALTHGLHSVISLVCPI